MAGCIASYGIQLPELSCGHKVMSQVLRAKVLSYAFEREIITGIRVSQWLGVCEIIGIVNL